jgi:hypothetical protein
MSLTRHSDKDGWRWYQEDGKPDKISVTTILDVAVPQRLKQYFMKNSKASQEKKLKEAGDIGTAIHAAVEADLNGDEVTLTDKTEPAFNEWLKLKKEHNISAVSTELMVSSDKYGFAGTADIIGWFDGKLCVMDIKTGYYSIKTGWQLGLYRLAHMETDTMKNELGLVGLSIKKDGSVGKPLVYEHIDYVTRAGLHCLEVFKALYFSKLNKMDWKYLKHDAIEDYWA